MVLQLNSLGYYPEQFDAMPYNIWAETFGKYRWYHEDGTPRTQYPLDYNWQQIYDIATSAADLAFSYRTITDPYIFTNEFLANVPINWLRYKTQLELFSGTLDGKTIDPDLFNQGFTRKMTHTEEVQGTGTTNDKIGERIDTNNSTDNVTSNAKTRTLNYEQGVQAYDNISNDNIGDYGNDYASNFSDSIGNGQEERNNETQSVQGQQENTQTVNSGVNSTFEESEEVRRINYYDNLAFLRDRMDRLNLIKPFQFYFEYLFNNVTSKTGFWA